MWAYILVTAVVFALLVPGVLVTLPPGFGSSSWVVLLTHGLVFALVHKYVQHGLMGQ